LRDSTETIPGANTGAKIICNTDHSRNTQERTSLIINIAEPQEQVETVESLSSQIPPELLEIIKHMNEAGVTYIIPIDESILSQIPAKLLEMINRMNKSGTPDENLLSQIPEALISLIKSDEREPDIFGTPHTIIDIPTVNAHVRRV
jgi:hypothetical protein